jgi:hypothetical protein
MEGRRIGMKQRAIVDRLRERGHDTAQAQLSLKLFEDALPIFERYLTAFGDPL